MTVFESISEFELCSDCARVMQDIINSADLYREGVYCRRFPGCLRLHA